MPPTYSPAAQAAYERYTADLASDDARTRAIAREALKDLAYGREARPAKPGRFGQLLPRLFEKQGNPTEERRNGTTVCGHQPWHDSSSGNCVVIWPEGRYWCSSCRESGDAVTFVMRLYGIRYGRALDYLARMQAGKP